jgi:hypothetical protein
MTIENIDQITDSGTVAVLNALNGKSYVYDLVELSDEMAKTTAAGQTISTIPATQPLTIDNIRIDRKYSSTDSKENNIYIAGPEILTEQTKIYLKDKGVYYYLDNRIIGTINEGGLISINDKGAEIDKSTLEVLNLIDGKSVNDINVLNVGEKVVPATSTTLATTATKDSSTGKGIMFEYRDGTLNRNIIYSFYGNEWKYSFIKDINIKKPSIDKWGIKESAFKSQQKDLAFINQIKDKNYIAGVKLLIGRTIANKESSNKLMSSSLRIIVLKDGKTKEWTLDYNDDQLKNLLKDINTPGTLPLDETIKHFAK